ncbi:hypothetical protein [Actomonas aquatica]|uniref:Sulfotransferase family protein n=1 Tax=Actomonas aquatica TaxID=2866162 RepID=A0ABZ1CF18_9BACT|nr:hypothetical protein [Opitutus sp. WL0086]WRQ90124.1 hypothetical protein K1X11_015715 [Opitutus sp. WL0086]
MWSGPRNISTALMRSFGARADCAVTDEPFYAHYLQATGIVHPGREEIIASQSTDATEVATWLSGPPPEGKAVWYQKHMTHHHLPGMPTDWWETVRHAFLIREPADMLTSLLEVLPQPDLEATGLPGQRRIYDSITARQGGVPPPVIDSRDVLRNPAGVLRALCERLGIAWDPAMLQWAPGPRPTDGVWARHWYRNVEASTGFAPYRPKDAVVPDGYRSVLAEAEDLYAEMAQHRLQVPDVS